MNTSRGGRRPARLLAGLAILAGCVAGAADVVLAQDGGRIIRPISKTSKEVRLYSDSRGAKPAGSIEVTALAFPLPVLREEGEFLLVRLQGRGEVWIDASEVVVERAVAAKCSAPTAAGTKPQFVAGTQGAGRACP